MTLGSELPTCPICDSASFREKFEKYRCHFLKCEVCGFITIFPPPDKKDLEAIYSQTYYKSWGMEKGNSLTVRNMKIKTALRLLKQVDKFRNTGNLLDVGCAAGHFLEAANDRGWQCYGVELSEYSASLAKEKFGNRIYVGSFETAPLPEAFFDLIIMSDVIEHFQDPNPILEKIRAILRDDGILVIVTPDSGSISASMFSSKWNHYEPEHLIYFNRKNILLCFKRHNLLPLIIKTAAKTMNLKYMYSQMTAYPHPFLTPMIGFINRVLPDSFLSLDLLVISGDMLVIAKKTGGNVC